MKPTFTGRTLPLKMRRIAEREAEHQPRKRITIHAMKCSRGCAHGYARSKWTGEHGIRLYLAMKVTPAVSAAHHNGTRGSKLHAMMFDNDQNRYLLIHELAHIASAYTGHGTMFYAEAIRIAKRERCLRGFLKWQGRAAQAANRRINADRRRRAA